MTKSDGMVWQQVTVDVGCERWGAGDGCSGESGYPTSFSSWAFLRWVLGGTPAACPIVIVLHSRTIDGSKYRRRIIGDSYTGGGVVLLVAADCPANQENCVRLYVCSNFLSHREC